MIACTDEEPACSPVREFGGLGISEASIRVCQGVSRTQPLHLPALLPTLTQTGAADDTRVTSPDDDHATTPLVKLATVGGASVSDGRAETGLPDESTAT